ncbi:Histidine acid phosphatase [Aphelenchoides bicaudatus]|nr:Histidine acid phosphatase [Aphelenchoides bicaudatus]
MEQSLQLGKKLRTKYIDMHKLVSPYFSTKEVYFRSSDTNRTLLSAMINSIGFYGNGRRGIDYPGIDGWPVGYVPVPVHTIAWKEDNLFNQYIRCTRAEIARKLLIQSPFYRSLKMKTKSLFDELSRITNKTTTLENCYFLYDAWHVHRLYNVPMPPEFTDDLYAQFEEVEHIMNDLQFGVGIHPFNGMDLRRELTLLRGGTDSVDNCWPLGEKS